MKRQGKRTIERKESKSIFFFGIFPFAKLSGLPIRIEIDGTDDDRRCLSDFDRCRWRSDSIGCWSVADSFVLVQCVRRQTSADLYVYAEKYSPLLSDLIVFVSGDALSRLSQSTEIWGKKFDVRFSEGIFHSNVKMSNTSSSQRRLIKDLQKIQSEDLPGINATPVDNDMRVWNALIDGPADTCYEDGLFTLRLEFAGRVSPLPSRPTGNVVFL